MNNMWLGGRWVINHVWSLAHVCALHVSWWEWTARSREDVRGVRNRGPAGDGAATPGAAEFLFCIPGDKEQAGWIRDVLEELFPVFCKIKSYTVPRQWINAEWFSVPMLSGQMSAGFSDVFTLLLLLPYVKNFDAVDGYRNKTSVCIQGLT